MKVIFEQLPPQVKRYFWIGLSLRLLATLFTSLAPDYVGYRLPIADCIASGKWLYCDCAYNHTPFYPYLSGLLNLLSFDQPLLQSVLITLPLAVGDALIVFAIYFLLKKFDKLTIAPSAALFYALNPIALIEVSLAHWDGFTTFFFLVGLIYLHDHKTVKSGVFVGLGVLLKQFPLALVFISFGRDKSVKKAIILGSITLAIVAVGFLPFLIKCPETFITNLSGHPLWKGAASTGVGIGTLKDLFEHLQIPQAKIVWLVIFSGLLILPMLKANTKNYFYFAGIVMVTLAWFTYVTHRQLLIWVMPFLLTFSLEKKNYWPLLLVAIGYAIRIIKPEWYFGLFYLVLGGWYYYVFLKEMIKDDPKTITS